MGPFLGVPDYGLRAGGCLDLSGSIPESCRIFARPLNLDSQSARGIFPSPSVSHAVVGHGSVCGITPVALRLPIEQKRSWCC